ncbi:RusA family crossover junction endodeoxyribonuclease [Brevundimonas sp.]|uniref:RusA family crossover junction endodeoxyribonuclease n=1 Tax=Brevundimonas sp. TaxID=1871086 RepID=UPI002D25647E|nr:RusA family crossover junction endodeoxyribonuclease [Brevundimonas sp.]HYD28895.1 RusA family crossover junction endodeoxyribonuclease [Brevundimonas sp.]
MTTLNVLVTGRPAPEGSHDVGSNGYVMHSSKYLAAWRHAVNRGTREAYVAAGLSGADMPLVPYPRPVWVTVLHLLLDEQCRAEGTDDPTGKPDGDKLLRATIDGLGEARAFGDDSQVIGHRSFKARGRRPGAVIQITDERPWWAEMNRERSTVETFNPNGEYRLVLEKVGHDSEGDRTWNTMFEVTDTADAIASTWLPSLDARLERELPAQGAAPTEQPASAPAKPRSTRAKKAAAPAEQPAPAAEQPAAAPAEPAPAPVMATPVAAPQTPAEPPRVNPFAKQPPVTAQA